MNCKHEFVEAQGTKMDYEKNDNGRIETLIRRKVCWKCYKTKTEIELELRLEAAETVCQSVEMLNNLRQVEGVGKWQLRSADVLLQECLRKWQEVVKCADQQQKK